MPRKSSVTPPSEGEFVRGNICDYLDRLEPSKGGKYYCPVCSGNDLSISEEGATTCYNNGCEWQAIMDIVNPLTDRPSSGNTPRATPKKTKKQKTQDAIGDEVAIESKTDELAYAASFGNIEEARAGNELATWCKANGHDKFAASRLLASKIKALKAARAENGDYSDDEEKPRLLKEYETIKKKFGDRLSYNQLKKEIELDGVLFEPVLAKTVFTIHHKTHLKGAKDDISDLVTLIAKENGYNPVTQYLDKVSAQYGDDTTVLNNLAKRYLGASRPIHEVVLMKFLISAVARAYKPGCKVDTALLLQGDEGYLKSTFFSILASDEFFDDPNGNTGDKDEKMKFHRAWIVEWSELENVFKKKDISQVKAMLSARIDILRAPYGKVYESMRRPSVFCATTNQNEVLSGSTGNRRFWVIPVTHKIDAVKLEQERDRIWAAIVACYKSGVQWWLTDDEELAMKDQRAHFETSDTWADEILDYLEGKDTAPLAKIIEVCFDIPTAQQDGRIQNRVKGILMKNGWKPLPSPIVWEGKKQRCWAKI